MADIDEEAFFQETIINDTAGSPLVAGRPLNPSEKGLLLIKSVLICVGMPFIFMVITASTYAFDSREATKFSMDLIGFQGLNATLGNTVSPTFSLKVRVENPNIIVQPWCYHGGNAVVSYSDVALAWGHVPRFCIEKKRTPTELRVLLLGRGVGLSEDLRRRLSSELQMGSAQVKVEMKLFYDDKGFSSAERSNEPVLQSFQLVLRHELHG
ncbi:unnamed protein product [Urochloa decumbens]|uniref:Late embryogenesis abundant protein LEA-2 subgroup domain-containing protein n=1 Tax=Urochloa decumbens TaxID=240449 RepID=A0ABC9C350_9POAL